MPYDILGANPSLINYLDLLVLGAFTGLTTLLRLPLAVVQTVTPKKKGFLNAFAIGILIFLIVDVLSHAWESASEVACQRCFSRRIGMCHFQQFPSW